MKNILKKIVVHLLVAALLCGIAPVATFADDGVTRVYTATELRQAIENGDDAIAVMGAISLYDNGIEGAEIEPFYIDEDTTIYLNNQIMMQSNLEGIDENTGFDPVFIVEGARLTLDCEENCYGSVEYYGFGSIIELIGSDSAQTAVYVNNGGLNAYLSYNYFTESTDRPTSVINVKNETTQQVDVSLYGGSFFCQTLDAMGGDGPVITGSGYQTTVKGGSFKADPSDMVDKGYAAIKDYDGYMVRYITDAKDSAIKSLLDKDGKFVVKRFEPGENDIDMMAFSLDMLYNYYGESDTYITFYWSSYNIENHTVYAALTDEPWGQPIETYFLEFKYIFDPDIKAEIDKIVDNIPQGEYNEEWEEYEHYYFGVSDLALINYWQTWHLYFDEYFEEMMPNDNINNLILYSDEFKQLVGYKNFSVMVGAGDGGPFFSAAIGDGEFKHGDTVYAAKAVGARADSIFYVPENTADDKLLETLQARIDEYMGEGITVTDKGSLLEYFLQAHYNGMGITQPYEEWKDEFQISDTYVADSAEIEELTNEAHYYSVTINDIEHLFVILKDDSKVKQPRYLNVDAATEVSVATKDASVPLDTLISVSSPDADTQAKLLDKLNAGAGESFDIKLHSGSLGGYVTKLENGNFEVKLPISEELKGMDLQVWYVDEKDNAVPYTTVIDEETGFATFTTDHFSVYTLAAPKAGKGDMNKDGRVDICDLVTLDGVMSDPAAWNYDLHDLNGDYIIDAIDLEELRKILLS